MNLRGVLCLVLLAAAGVFAQDEDAGSAQPEQPASTAVIEQVVALEPSPDAKTVHVFPSAAEKKFTVADPNPVELLLGFENTGDNVFNITSIQASLMYPPDHRYFIQNYTRAAYGVIVSPAEQHTIAYRFLPDPGLDARDFDLVATVYYTDSAGGNFSSVFFNDTITLLDRQDAVNAQQFFTYVGVLGLVGLVSYIAYRKFFAHSKKQRPRARVEMGTRNVPASENEWLAGTSATASPGSAKRSTSPKKASSPKSR